MCRFYPASDLQIDILPISTLLRIRCSWQTAAGAVGAQVTHPVGNIACVQTSEYGLKDTLDIILFNIQAGRM